MIGLLASRLGVEISARALRAFALAGLIALAGVCAWLAVKRFDSIIDKADRRGHARATAEFRAAIAEANADAARARAEQAAAASAASSIAEEKIFALRLQLTDLEKANASLAGGDRCGLDAGRVRLLDPRSGAAAR